MKNGVRPHFFKFCHLLGLQWVFLGKWGQVPFPSALPTAGNAKKKNSIHNLGVRRCLQKWGLTPFFIFRPGTGGRRRGCGKRAAGGRL
jgi:hypothetical protein